MRRIAVLHDAAALADFRDFLEALCFDIQFFEVQNFQQIFHNQNAQRSLHVAF